MGLGTGRQRSEDERMIVLSQRSESVQSLGRYCPGSQLGGQKLDAGRARAAARYERLSFHAAKGVQRSGRIPRRMSGRSETEHDSDAHIRLSLLF